MKFVKYPDGSKDPCVQFTGTNEQEIIALIGEHSWEEIKGMVGYEKLKNAFVVFDLKTKLIRVAREIPKEFELIDEPDIKEAVSIEIEHDESFLIADVMEDALFSALPVNFRRLLENTFVQLYQDTAGNLGIGFHTCDSVECREHTAKTMAAKTMLDMSKAREDFVEKHLSEFKGVVDQFLGNVTKH